MSTERDSLVPDYDELPIGKLRDEIRALPADDIQRLIEHEHAHANRTRVLELLRMRQRQLAEGRQPSGGDPWGRSGKPADTPHDSPVSPHRAAEPGRPLRHGVASQTPKRDRP